MRLVTPLFALLVVGCANLASPNAPLTELMIDRQLDGRLIAPVLVDGAGPFPFLIDTGATVTVLDTSLAEELGVAPRGYEVAVHGAGGSSLAPAYDVVTITLGDEAMEPTWVVAMDLPDASTARGILGVDVLSQRVIEIDGDADILRLRRDGYAPPLADRASRSRLFVDVNGLPHVEIRINDARGLALVDTGMGGMLIDPDLAERAGVPTTSEMFELRDVTNEEMAARRTGRARLRIGSVYWMVDRVVVLRPDVLDRLDAGGRTEAVLGAIVFADLTVVIDFDLGRFFVVGAPT